MIGERVRRGKFRRNRFGAPWWVLIGSGGWAFCWRSDLLIYDGVTGNASRSEIPKGGIMS